MKKFLKRSKRVFKVAFPINEIIGCLIWAFITFVFSLAVNNWFVIELFLCVIVGAAVISFTFNYWFDWYKERQYLKLLERFPDSEYIQKKYGHLREK